MVSEVCPGILAEFGFLGGSVDKRSMDIMVL
jgi:hypothetical protein